MQHEDNQTGQGTGRFRHGDGIARLPGNALDCLPHSLRSGPQSLFGGLSCATPQPLSPKEGVAPLPVAPAPYPKSHPFAWFPLAGQRYAIDRRDRNIPVGSPMRCLCGVTHPGVLMVTWNGSGRPANGAGMRHAGLWGFGGVGEGFGPRANGGRCSTCSVVGAAASASTTRLLLTSPLPTRWLRNARFGALPDVQARVVASGMP